MSTIPFLDNPMELAKERILTRAMLISVSIDRLKHQINNFQTHKGLNVSKAIRRRQATNAVKELEPLLKKGEEFQRHYLIAKKKGDTESLAQLGYLYTVYLTEYKSQYITAFSYDHDTNQYNSVFGVKSWNWMCCGLLVPEIK